MKIIEVWENTLENEDGTFRLQARREAATAGAEPQKPFEMAALAVMDHEVQNRLTLREEGGSNKCRTQEICSCEDFRKKRACCHLPKAAAAWEQMKKQMRLARREEPQPKPQVAPVERTSDET